MYIVFHLRFLCSDLSWTKLELCSRTPLGVPWLGFGGVCSFTCYCSPRIEAKLFCSQYLCYLYPLFFVTLHTLIFATMHECSHVSILLPFLIFPIFFTFLIFSPFCCCLHVRLQLSERVGCPKCQVVLATKVVPSSGYSIPSRKHQCDGRCLDYTPKSTAAGWILAEKQGSCS